MSLTKASRGDGGGEFSASGWVDATLRAALTRVVPATLELARPFRPRGLLLSGSAALGEAVGWEAEDPGERFVLSDLDLGLVTADRVPEVERTTLREAARAAGFQARPTAEPFESGEQVAEKLPVSSVEVTLGFYESTWWSRQAPTPGLVDARARGTIAWGDATLLDRLSVPSAARIPAWEALRLVGNRALELLAAPGPHSAPALRPRSWHALAKAVTGIWTARLVIEGRYETGWAARRALLEAAGGCEGRAAGDPVVRAALAWGPFLERPSAETLPPSRDWIAAYRESLAAWLDSLPPALRPPGDSVESAFLAQPGSLRNRLRAWRAEGRMAGGGLSGRGRHAVSALWGAFPWAAGTPEGRRLAVATLYWRDLPERPEPFWGETPDDELDATGWEKRVRCLLGRPVSVGLGCRARVAAALGLRAQRSTGGQEGYNG